MDLNRLMKFFWKGLIQTRVNLFLLGYIEYYFYNLVRIVDKLVLVEDEERLLFAGSRKDPE